MTSFSKKRILVISALDIWSMGQKKGAPSLLRTIKNFAEHGWKVFFLTGNKKKDSVYDIHPNIRIIRFNSSWLNINAFFGRSIWWLYFQILAFFIGYRISRKEKIDFFYGYEVQGIPVSKVLSKIFKKPIISRFQGTKLSAHLQEKFWKIKYWDDVFAMKIPVDLLIMANDGTMGDKVLRKINAKTKKVKFWLNGVDKNIYIPNFDKNNFKKELKIEKNKKILLAISRLEKWKRVDRIIKTMSRVLKAESETELLIIGDGKEKENLEKLVKELKVENGTRFLGALPHDELKKYYNLADIFISTYDISNVGNPLLEALSCGKCIVTLDIGDTDKFIHNEKNGILVKLDKINILPDIIIKLLKDNEKRKRLEENAKEFAKNNLWTWKERMETEFDEVRKL
ncbi:MAG: glycosyltransferase family 4 protein [Candidatus Pacebacteria bacterium]|nr:glycosyltransferase family 4 protein [Candidatus Paceibacterota bacterium]